MGKQRLTIRQKQAPKRTSLCRLLTVATVGILGVLHASPSFGQSARNPAELISQLMPQVVNLAVTTYPVTAGNVGNMAAQSTIAEKKTNATGFIVDPSGLIVTNRHAVAGADYIMVVLNDGTRLRATLLASTTLSDIAVLKVNADRPLRSVSFGDSDGLRIGDPILLAGNPLGQKGTVTSGIVSALDRSSRESESGSFMQIDAPLNHGNSGGPVFDAAGQVVGMATALQSTDSGDGSVGLGFMIPSNDVQVIFTQLMTGKPWRLGWIGAYVDSMAEDDARAAGLVSQNGCIVLDVVADSPAATAGLRAGDVILKVGNLDAVVPRVLNRKIGSTAIGSTVDLTVSRNGGQMRIPVAIAEVPGGERSSKPPEAASPVTRVDRDDLGLLLGPIPVDMQRRLRRSRGVAVADVVPHSVADDHAVRPGSMILNIDQVEVNSVVDVQQRIQAAQNASRQFLMLLVADDLGLHWSTLPIRQ